LLASTYPDRDRNPEMLTGSWRPLNLELAPFDLPRPIQLVNEESEKPGYPDKSLGLWRVGDLPVDKLRAVATSRLSGRRFLSRQ
jgi:hypothetical protein